MRQIRRRQFLSLGVAVSASLLLAAPLARATGKPATGRFVWINLRGAMDGLHAVVPAFDQALRDQRGALVTPLESSLLALDGGFALHPELKTLHAWYREKSLAPVVAVASPYRERSHFIAQDVLESGLLPADQDSGWLARALRCGGLAESGGIAIAPSLPVVLRGEKDARTWYPSALPPADEDLYQRLLALYADDAQLQTRLQEGLATRAGIDMAAMADAQARRPRLATLARACGEMLAENPALRGATLEMNGWDTHNQQLGRLAQQFKQLDEGLAALRQALGTAWSNTVVAIGTEFGRTVAVNGTGGTDHGTASVMFLTGGALAGGRVLGDWPGLGRAELQEQRDLRPTSDIREWLAGALGLAWGLDDAQVGSVFAGVKPRRLTAATRAASGAATG